MFIITLKHILRSKYLYIGLLVITIIQCLITLFILDSKSLYNGDENDFILEIITLKNSDSGKTITFKGRENLICHYQGDFLYNEGDIVHVKGELTIPKNNTIPNLFNYKKYLYREGIFYILEIENISLIKENINLLNKIKRIITKRINQYNSNKYLQSFILGDTSYIDKDVRLAYQNIGISHLLAIGGMHISLLVMLLNFILKKINRYVSFLVIISFLLIYLFLVNYQVSIVRSTITFTLISLNKFLKLSIKYDYIMILVLIIVLLIDPFNIYNLGFQYSYLISFTLVKCQSLIKGNYLKKTIIVSLIAFLCSMPITIYNNYQFNYLSLLYNLFYIPFINIILFPLCIITFIFKPLDFILVYIANNLEKISLFFNSLNTNIILKKPSIWLIIIYYIIIFYTLNLLLKRKYDGIYIFILILLIHYNYNYIFRDSYITMLDVSQGDAIILHHSNETWLIDTGGSFSYDYSENIITYLKSMGIREIDKLIITHGDYDHIGSSYNIVNTFKVKMVYFNKNDYNKNENKLIKILNSKKIIYRRIDDKFFLRDMVFYAINPLITDEENESSIVLYGKINEYSLLLMGDSSIRTEKEILDKYSLNKVNILKVGHHGSITSSSNDFIKQINPDISLISVGKNNFYGHPNKEVLEILKNSKIYETDNVGSVYINLRKNGKLFTYKP